MSSPLIPTSTRVGQAWLALAVPAPVRVGDRLPEPVDDDLVTVGFVRTTVVGGNVDRDGGFRYPVIAAECFIAPDQTTRLASWDAAEQLANRIVAATEDPALMGVVVDPPGDYAPARVHTVIALGVPVRVTKDPGDFARFDVDLLINWTGA